MRPPLVLGLHVEILDPDIERGKIRHVLFDFDGTLSLIREGWQNVMIPMMVDELCRVDASARPSEIEGLVREFVTRLTGKQTIYQMIELADQARRRGGAPPDPLEYKREYLRRLERRIQSRIDGLAGGAIDPESLLVPGARRLLESLRDRGVRMWLASGTDEPFVIREARLLKIDRFFDGGIFGAQDHYQSFSKRIVIERILREHSLSGPELLAIGDGYVEIENAKAAGGIAWGVATHEPDPVSFDSWKKSRLAEAGADLLTANFLEAPAVLSYLFADGG
jgi:phosphoglycolate phosphatase-like HAD superfamily hydrolase